MIKLYLVILGILSCVQVNAQKEGYSKIIVHPTDTSNLYKRVKWSFIKLDFIVKDLESDTIKTYAREFLNNDFLIGTAFINGTDVVISGIWGSRNLTMLGYSLSPKNYKTVTYYKGCVEWKVLRLVAEGIGGSLTFEE